MYNDDGEALSLEEMDKIIESKNINSNCKVNYIKDNMCFYNVYDENNFFLPLVRTSNLISGQINELLNEMNNIKYEDKKIENKTEFMINNLNRYMSNMNIITKAFNEKYNAIRENLDNRVEEVHNKIKKEAE